MDNGHEPAWRADSVELRSEAREDFARLCSFVRDGFADLKKSMRDGQAEIFKVLSGYTQSNYERIAAREQDSASVLKRLAILESRMTEVERRLNQPPTH